MSRLSRLLALLPPALGACFFDQPINERPAVTVASVGVPVYKGDSVTLHASVYDDDPSALRHAWMAAECDGEPRVCDWPFATAAAESFTLTIPSKRTIRVSLSAFDGYGAHGDAVVELAAQNRAPTVALQLQGVPAPTGGYTLGRTLVVAVAAADPDGVAPLDPAGDELSLGVAVVGPGGARPTLVPIGASAWSFTPGLAGEYTASVVVDDGDGGSDSDAEVFAVLPDAPPCLGALSAPPGVLLVLEQAAGPRRLAVLTVADDLDPYPAPAVADPLLGEARFRWESGPPGARVDVDGHDLAEIEIDPAGLWPGDRLEVRVEIADRIPRVLPCADDEPSCSVAGDSCLQRVTWTLEVR